MLIGPYGVVGLSLATAIGIWVNLGLLVVPRPAPGLDVPEAARSAARRPRSAWQACCLPSSPGSRHAPLAAWTASLPAWRNEILLAILGATGALIYGGALLAGLKVLGVRLSRR